MDLRLRRGKSRLKTLLFITILNIQEKGKIIRNFLPALINYIYLTCELKQLHHCFSTPLPSSLRPLLLLYAPSFFSTPLPSPLLLSPLLSSLLAYYPPSLLRIRAFVLIIIRKREGN